MPSKAEVEAERVRGDDDAPDDYEGPRDHTGCRLTAKEQDALFQVAMRRAIEAGLELAPLVVVRLAGAPDAKYVPAVHPGGSSYGSPAAQCADFGDG